MRRAEREISDRREIDRIIRRATVCRLAFLSRGEPYLVPVSFGYDGDALYFHCAPEGRKLDMLSPGVKVCFELEADVSVVSAQSACGWTMAFSSVIGWGTAALVHDPAQRAAALDTIMDRYGGPAGPYGEKILGRTAVVRIGIERIGAKSNHPQPVNEAGIER